MEIILVIDDRETIGGSTVELLETVGFRTWLASTGSVGLDLIEEKNPGLILCNHRLPELDGYDLLRTLRLDARFVRLPFYIMAAHSIEIESEQLKGMSLGATGYLITPFSNEDLLNCICRHFTLPIQ